MEGLFSTNKFNVPKVIEGKEEVVVLIIRLLIMEPGSNPLHPEMGVGLLQRYKNCAADELPELELEIKKQIIIYLPRYQEVNIKITSEKSIMRIYINIDDTLYKFTTSESPIEDEISLINLR